MRRNDTMAAVIAVLAACSTTPSTSDRPSAEKAYAEAEDAFRAGDFDRAIARATDAIAGAPDLPKPYWLRAKARHAKGDTAAETDFTAAVDKAQGSRKLTYYFWRGLFYADTKQHEKALQDFHQACEMQVKNPIPEYYIECFWERGKTYLALGRNAEAVQDFDFILARNPDETTRRDVTRLRDEALRKK